jgi:hypothetical protein
MPSALSRKKSDQMMEIAQLYIEAGGEEPIDLDKLANFAIDKGYWQKGNLASLRVQLCKREFSKAFRDQHHSDPQGRQVRTWHAAVNKSGEQGTFWGDIRSAPEEHMEVAFQQRRSQIVGDCTQLKTDVDSWNDNNTHGGSFQLILDFTDDAEERQQPTKYVPKPR